MQKHTSGILDIFYRILLILGLALLLFIAGGTIYGLLFHNVKPLYTIPAPQDAMSPQGQSLPAGGDGIFTGIGRLRAVTGDMPPVTVVISVAFPYNPEDGSFTEELAAKVPAFRKTVAEYFSAHTAAELREMNDQTIKAELLRRYNALLRLGTIETLYFNDLMFID